MYIRDLRPTNYSIIGDLDIGESFIVRNVVYTKCDTSIVNIPEDKCLVMNVKSGYVKYMSAYDAVLPVAAVTNIYDADHDVIDPLTGEVIYQAKEKIELDFQFE